METIPVGTFVIYLHGGKESAWNLIETNPLFADLSKDQKNDLSYMGYEVGLVCRLSDDGRHAECLGIEHGTGKMVPLAETLKL